MDSGKYVDESIDLNWYWVYIIQFNTCIHMCHMSESHQ